MKFGPVSVQKAKGAVLAHSLRLKDGVVRKGTVLADEHLARLAKAGVTEVIVAQLEPDDLPEDDAAAVIAARLATPGLRPTPAATGRVNLIAEVAGLVRVDAAAISAMNAVDEGVTLATLPDLMRVAPDQLVATVKIIPYAAASATIEKAAGELGDAAVRLLPFHGGDARLIMTRTDSFKDSVVAKGEAVVRERLAALGYRLTEVDVVRHEINEVAKALPGQADLILFLGASATSDRADVGPAAVRLAGGCIDRFGIPVDPGNLLFLGALDDVPVVGLPGCARSPALNGADWVLERLAAGLSISHSDFAAMGVGGLLKEMPDRPHPRRSREKE